VWDRVAHSRLPYGKLWIGRRWRECNQCVNCNSSDSPSDWGPLGQSCCPYKPGDLVDMMILRLRLRQIPVGDTILGIWGGVSERSYWYCRLDLAGKARTVCEMTTTPMQMAWRIVIRTRDKNTLFFEDIRLNADFEDKGSSLITQHYLKLGVTVCDLCAGIRLGFGEHCSSLLGSIARLGKVTRNRVTLCHVTFCYSKQYSFFIKSFLKYSEIRRNSNGRD